MVTSVYCRTSDLTIYDGSLWEDCTENLSELKMGRDKVSIEYCRGLCPSANNLLL